MKNHSFVILSYFLKGAIKANNLKLLAFFYISIIFIVCYTLRSDKIKRKEITVEGGGVSKKRLFELFLVTFALLFLHVSTFTNEKLNDKFGNFTFFVVFLMFYINVAFIKRYFDDIQKWIRNITFLLALLVVTLISLWIGYF